MSDLGAFGAGPSRGSGSFDPVNFVRKPTVILRLICLMFALIVFGCISGGGWVTPPSHEQICVFRSGGCGFGVAVGVLAFLAAILMLALEAYFENISSVELRKQIVIADLGVSGFFTGFYFILFCYLTDMWRKFDAATAGITDTSFDYSRPQAAIAFAFFSIFSWAVLTFFGYRRFQDGAAVAFAPSYDQEFGSSGVPPFGYPGGAPGGSEQYQEPPFSSSVDSGAGQQYKPPAY